jgi:hypothetical protein
MLLTPIKGARMKGYKQLTGFVAKVPKIGVLSQKSGKSEITPS